MISDVTMEQLNRFAAEGRLGAMPIRFAADDLSPEAGGDVTLRWDFSDSHIDLGTLHISGAARILVPAVGSHRVRVGAAPVSANLRVGNDSADVRIVPQVIIPVIGVLAFRGDAVVGKSMRLRWRTGNAVRCELQVCDGELVTEQAVESRGEIGIVPRHTGLMRVTLTAFSRHADLSDDAFVSAEAFVDVALPPVTIEMSATSKIAFTGEEVSFRWTISEAIQARLEATDRDETLAVPLQGEVWVTASHATERFRLVATGADGSEKAVQFKVVSHLIESINVPIALNALSSHGSAF